MRRAPTSVVLMAGLVLLAGLSGCGDDERDQPDASATPQSLTVAVDELPTSLDPARARSVGERAIAFAVQTPLLTYKRRTDADAATLEPALARDLPVLSPDETEYRFTLRPGLLYADGRLVTASDVERSIAHASVDAADPELREVLAGIIGSPSRDGQTLSGVRTDDRTGAIVVRLRSPDGRIPLVLADPATAPQPELPKAGLGTLPASTGSLRVARVTRDSIELVSNPLRARISTVPAAQATQVSVTSRAATPATLVRGDVDLDLDPTRTADLPDSVDTVEGGTGEIWSLLLAPRGDLASRTVRRGLGEAVDRRKLDESTESTGVAAACGLLPGYVTGSVVRDDCPPAPVKPSSAALAVAGIRLAVPRQGSTAVLAVVRAALGSAVAAGGEVVTADPVQALTEGRADAALVQVRPSLPHPAAWLAPAASVDELLARELPRQTAGPLTGSEARWSDLERRAVDRFVAVPLAVGRQTVLVGPSTERASVLLHPVLGVDLTALRAR